MNTGLVVLTKVVSTMAVGFVLINTVPAKEHAVFTELSKVSEIKDLHLLFGEYDIIAKIDAENYDAIASTILNKIRRIDGVVSTKTLTQTSF
jgi:DNA-binding Lrp family transcriptional regulator